MPGARIETVQNGSPSQQHSLLIDNEHAVAIHGPVIIRMRTSDRADGNHLPSLTPIWRSAEFQEREIFDLYGIRFKGHPDLRRILMWDEFEHYPMRKDYREPDDYEWEPTPHDEVLERAKQHYPPRPAEKELKPS